MTMWNRGSDSAGRLSERFVDGAHPELADSARSRLDFVRFTNYDEEDNMAVVHDTSATLAQCVLITIAG